MPRIQILQSRAAAPEPTERGKRTAEQFGAGVGRALQEFGGEVKQVGNIVQRREEQGEISRMSAEMATAQADLQNLWQETLRTADPNDTELAERFVTEQVAPRLDEIGGSASTRAGRLFFDKLGAGVQADFTARTATGEADLAGLAAMNNMQTAANRLTTAVRNDPSFFPAAVDSFELMAEGLIATGGLSRADALRAQTQIQANMAASAIMGNMEFDPVGTRADIESGAYGEFIGGKQADQLIQRTKAVERAQKADARAARVEAERLEDKQFETTESELVGELIDDDGNISVPPGWFSRVENELDGDPKRQRTSLNLGRAIQNQETTVKSDPFVVQDFEARAVLPFGDDNRTNETEINQAVVDKQLTLADRSKLLAALEVSATPEGKRIQTKLETTLKGLVKAIDGSNPITGFIDVDGAQRAAAFRNSMTDFFYDNLNSGTLTADEMLDTKSPNFIGNFVSEFAPPGASTPEALNAVQSILSGETILFREDGSFSTEKTPVKKRKLGLSIEEMDKL